MSRIKLLLVFTAFLAVSHHAQAADGALAVSAPAEATADQPHQRRQYSPVYTALAMHRVWCFLRYRSYRSRDHTFQPSEGPRQRCVSPYYQ